MDEFQSLRSIQPWGAIQLKRKWTRGRSDIDVEATSGQLRRQTLRRNLTLGVFAAGLASLPVLASSAPGLPVGPNLTYGDGSHPISPHTLGSNPAGAAASRRVGVQFGLGSLGAGYEFGDIGVVEQRLIDLVVDNTDVQEGEVDSLFDALDELGDVLDGDDVTAAGDLSGALLEGGVMRDLGTHANMKVGGYARAPLMPLTIGSAAGGWALELDFDVTGAGGFSIMDDEIRVDTDWQEPVQSNVSAYLQGGYTARASIAPSIRVGEWQDRSLYLGARINHYDTELYRNLIALQGMEDDFDDVVEDELDQRSEQSTEIGLDLGLVYQASIYRAGVTWLNINEPEFDYPDFDRECGGLDGDARRNCEAARVFAGQNPEEYDYRHRNLDLEESWTLNEQVRLDFALHDPGQRMVLALSYDTNSVRDIVGDEYQWLAASAAFQLPWYMAWVPDLRIGYRENQVGSELTYYSAGLTWLGVLSLDVAVADEETEIEEDDVPRSAIGNLSLQMRF